MEVSSTLASHGVSHGVSHGASDGAGDVGASPLRVAVLSPIAWRTPPRHYGPWELFASLLTEGLVAIGHDVTLFATADSRTTAKLHATSPRGWSDGDAIDAIDSIEPKVAECLHIASVFERAAEFDVIHNGFDFLPLSYSELVETLVVTTIHGFSSARIVPVYERYTDSTAYVAISESDRHPRLRYAATIHHGIDVEAFQVHKSPGEHLLFFGRIHRDKGTAHAIEVARLAGRRLIIAGIVQDDDYFRTEVEPHIDGDRVRFVGAVGAVERAELLGSVHALLHLIDFDEPFGFSVVEAMACGTPVIAYNRGSMSELIRNRETGYLVTTILGAVEATTLASDLDRGHIRNVTVERFDASVMAARYSALYYRLLSQRATQNHPELPTPGRVRER
jgi:glycosyltransferase involved in cell wall biosynthesis